MIITRILLLMFIIFNCAVAPLYAKTVGSFIKAIADITEPPVPAQYCTAIIDNKITSPDATFKSTTPYERTSLSFGDVAVSSITSRPSLTEWLAITTDVNNIKNYLLAGSEVYPTLPGSLAPPAELIIECNRLPTPYSGNNIVKLTFGKGDGSDMFVTGGFEAALFKPTTGNDKNKTNLGFSLFVKNAPYNQWIAYPGTPTAQVLGELQASNFTSTTTCPLTSEASCYTLILGLYPNIHWVKNNSSDREFVLNDSFSTVITIQLQSN